MYSTLKVMSTVDVACLSGLSINEVAEVFSNIHDKPVEEITPQDRELQNKCFAHIFCELFPMFMSIFKKYPILSEDDRVDEILGGLLRSVKKYKCDKNVKFTSYVYGNVCNGLMNACKSATTTKGKKVWMCMVNADSETQDFILNSIKDKNGVTETEMFLQDLKKSTVLKETEKEYCRNVLAGFKNSNEIAKNMKLTEIPKYDKTTKQYVTCPVTDDTAKKFILNIKKSIKDKAKKNGFSLL